MDSHNINFFSLGTFQFQLEKSSIYNTDASYFASIEIMSRSWDANMTLIPGLQISLLNIIQIHL